MAGIIIEPDNHASKYEDIVGIFEAVLAETGESPASGMDIPTEILPEDEFFKAYSAFSEKFQFPKVPDINEICAFNIDLCLKDSRLSYIFVRQDTVPLTFSRYMHELGHIKNYSMKDLPAGIDSVIYEMLAFLFQYSAEEAFNSIAEGYMFDPLYRLCYAVSIGERPECAHLAKSVHFIAQKAIYELYRQKKPKHPFPFRQLYAHAKNELSRLERIELISE